jgi:hypothetical protein
LSKDGILEVSRVNDINLEVIQEKQASENKASLSEKGLVEEPISLMMLVPKIENTKNEEN